MLKLSCDPNCFPFDGFSRIKDNSCLEGLMLDIKKDGLPDNVGAFGGGEERMRLHKKRGVLVTLDTVKVFPSPFSSNDLRLLI